MRNPKLPASALLLLLAAAGPALRAAEGQGPDPFHYGVRLYMAQPRQDLRDLDPRRGFGGGLFAEGQLTDTLWIQSRVDYVNYPQADQPSGAAPGGGTVPAPLTLAANSASLGFDLHWYPEITFLGTAVHDRFFLMAGAMAVRYEFKSSGATPPAGAATAPDGLYRAKGRTPVKLGWAVGAGVDLTDWLDLTVRYTTVDVEGATLGSLETGIGIRF